MALATGVHQFPTSCPPLGLAGPAVGQMWCVAHVKSQPKAAHAACRSKEGSKRGRRVVGKRGERREVRGRREGGEVKKRGRNLKGAEGRKGGGTRRRGEEGSEKMSGARGIVIHRSILQVSTSIPFK